MPASTASQGYSPHQSSYLQRILWPRRRPHQLRLRCRSHQLRRHCRCDVQVLWKGHSSVRDMALMVRIPEMRMLHADVSTQLVQLIDYCLEHFAMGATLAQRLLRRAIN